MCVHQDEIFRNIFVSVGIIILSLEYDGKGSSSARVSSSRDVWLSAQYQVHIKRYISKCDFGFKKGNTGLDLMVRISVQAKVINTDYVMDMNSWFETRCSMYNQTTRERKEKANKGRNFHYVHELHYMPKQRLCIARKKKNNS